MRKSFFLTLALILMISFSCQDKENNPEPEVNFEEASAFFSEMFTNTLNYTVTNLELNERRGNIELANANLVGEFLNQNYFPELSMKLDFDIHNPNARISSGEEHFSDEQLSFITDMDKSMEGVMSAQGLYSVIEEYRIRATVNKTMTDEQKLEMLALVEYSYALHEFLVNGGVSEFVEVLPNEISSNSNARVTNERPKYEILECDDDTAEGGCPKGGGCSVDWRSVWAGAVVGLTYGATTGAIAGGTTGTVVFPVVGTVTGAVSAGVVGGAIGFVEGAVLGVAGSLLLSCGR